MPGRDGDNADPAGAAVADPARHAMTLFAPAEARPGLWALIAFHAEIAKVRETVREPTLGLMRLRWWHDALDGVFAGAPRAHPAAVALADAVQRHDLPRAPLDRMIDARERDLDAEPPPDEAALLAYAAASQGPMIDLAARVLGRPLDPAIADLVGTADALAGLALAVPFRAAIGRVDLPADWLAAAGLHAQSVGDRRHRTRLIDVMRRFVEAAQAARREAVAAVAGHHPTQRPALLPLVAARRRLVRLAAVGEDPFDPRLGRPDPWRTLAFWLAARRGRL